METNAQNIQKLEIKESSEQPCPETLDEGLEFIFFGMLRQGNMSDAIDFIRSLDVDILPSKPVFRAIIFNILMKCDNAKCLALSADYLLTILSVFPPNTESMRTYYFDCIRDSQGYLDDLWTVFSHIVNSYYYHHSIYVMEKGESRTELIKYPNCRFLLEFYVKLFVTDFEFLYVKSFQPCLVMKLLWSGGHNICLSTRTEVLLKWINDIYGTPMVHKMGELLGWLHDILTLMIKCFLQEKFKLSGKCYLQEKFNVSDVGSFKPSCLSEVVEATVNFCKNSFANHKNVQLFLISISSVKAFRARVSERIIKQLTRQVSKRTYVHTLKDIVNQCLFPQKNNNKWKAMKPNKSKEKNLRKRPDKDKEKKPIPTTSDKKKEATKLHELARNKMFGDLREAIQDYPNDLNAVDSQGCTPLHLACEENHYLTVKVLVDESKKDYVPNLDFTAPNLDGLTALHLAVMKNSIEITRELLSAGGSDALNIKDNKGFKPSDWSSNPEMDKLLQEYQPEMSSTESDSTNESNMVKEAPSFKSFNDYSIYLHTLTCLLSTYCELFNLYEFVYKKTDVVKSHASRECCHYVDEDVCSEDADIIPEMRELIYEFIKSLQKNNKNGYSLDIELIPLKAFAASVTVP